MTRDEVLAFVKANPVSFMATVERGKPRVRAMQTALVEPAGLVFCTGVQKDVYQQLVASELGRARVLGREEGRPGARARRDGARGRRGGDEADRRRGVHVPEARRRAVWVRDIHLLPAREGDVDRLAHGPERRTARDRGVLDGRRRDVRPWGLPSPGDTVLNRRTTSVGFRVVTSGLPDRGATESDFRTMSPELQVPSRMPWRWDSRCARSLTDCCTAVVHRMGEAGDSKCDLSSVSIVSPSRLEWRIDWLCLAPWRRRARRRSG